MLRDVTNLKIRIQKTGTSYCIKREECKPEDDKDTLNVKDTSDSKRSCSESSRQIPDDGTPVHWDDIARAKWTATKFYCRVRCRCCCAPFYFAPATRCVGKSG